MPSALKKRRGYRGCPRLTRERYCEEHLPLARRFYDRRRGSTTERGYDSDWKKLAERRRQLDAYLCQRCLQQGLLRCSPLVDHMAVGAEPQQSGRPWPYSLTCTLSRPVATNTARLKYALPSARRDIFAALGR